MSSLSPIDITQNHFELLGVPHLFGIDEAALERTWRALQKQYHPDRSVNASEAEQRRTLQIATQVNEAYQTLKNPLKRAEYLLAQKGVDLQQETQTTFSPDFLMAQMAWREAVDEARDAGDLSRLEVMSQRVRRQILEAYEELKVLLDITGDLPAAAEAVKRLMFFDKLQRDIRDAQAQLEDE